MKTNWLKSLITAVVMLVITVVFSWIKGVFTAESLNAVMKILCDAFFIVGAMALGVGLLVFCANQGAFDILGYGLHTLFSPLLKDPTKRKYRTYHDYKQGHEGKGKDFSLLIIFGAVFVAISIVLLVIYNNTAVA